MASVWFHQPGQHVSQVFEAHDISTLKRLIRFPLKACHSGDQKYS